jgi:hypothetical protein
MPILQPGLGGRSAQCQRSWYVTWEYSLNICDHANRGDDFLKILRRLSVGQVKHLHHIIAATWCPVFVHD